MCSVVRSFALVRSCLGLSLYSAHAPSFNILYYFTIILVSASSSCLPLAVVMREVSCAGYTLCAWEPSSP